MILSAAGAVDHDALHSIADEMFSGMTSEAPPSDEEGKVRGRGMRLSDKRFEQCHVLYAFEGFPNDHHSTFRRPDIRGHCRRRNGLHVCFRKCARRRGLCYDVHAFDWGLFRQWHNRTSCGHQLAAASRTLRGGAAYFSPILPRKDPPPRSLRRARKLKSQIGPVS